MTDPKRADALLADLERNGRGRLKVFLGAAPGVGKTYAMLLAAQGQLRQGVNLRVGIVETHGRAETEALLAGLPQQPLLRSEYRGIHLAEMDLDGLLREPPQLALVDELAHSNAPGSRHAKRWQDIQELLAAGIDVYTTVNVQHLESLNDQVRDITGVQVRETVPDWVLQEADELLLVDLPTAFYVTAAQIDGSKIVGQLPQTEGGSTEHFGLLMEKGSTLVGCLNQAVGQLKSSGELAKIQQQWLTSSAGAPVLK